MSKPTTVYYKESQQSFKECCQEWHVKFCWIDGVMYTLPEGWNNE